MHTRIGVSDVALQNGPQYSDSAIHCDSQSTVTGAVGAYIVKDAALVGSVGLVWSEPLWTVTLRKYAQISPFAKNFRYWLDDVAFTRSLFRAVDE